MSLELVPENRRAATRAALRAVFGSDEVQSLEPISGGASGALICRVRVHEQSALLRLENARDAFRDPVRAYKCMRIAAAAGVAPPLHYADADSGIALMDLVSCVPYPHGAHSFARELGTLIARLHAAPLFPAFVELRELLDRLLSMLSGSGLFRAGLLDAHRIGFERLRAAYPWDHAAPVSSHNDLNPTNVLCDGTRLWLVDWEIAYRADPLFDVAIAAEHSTLDHDCAEILLAAAMSGEVDQTSRARFTLMRQFARLYYACLMLSACIGRMPVQNDLEAPSLLALRADIASGALPLGSLPSLHAAGKAFLASFHAGFTDPICRDALSSFERSST